MPDPELLASLKQHFGFDGFRPGQEEAVRPILAGRDSLVVMPTGAGKCLGRGTPVLMYDGTVRPAEQVRAGDLLMGPDSKPRRVLSTTSGHAPLYRVTPNRGGEPYVVNGDHVLSLKTTRQRGPWPSRQAGRIVNISVNDWMSASRTFRHVHKGWRTGVEFATACTDPVLPPYLLGLWLGDSAASGAGIVSADHEIVDYLRSYVDEIGMQVTKLVKKGNAASNYLLVKRDGPRGRGCKSNPLLNSLRAMDLLKNKHIPQNYLVNSREARLNLLAGLVDSDGCLSRNKAFDLVFKSERLAQDTIFLARSLGFGGSINKCKKRCHNNGVEGEYYRLTITGRIWEIPCKVARKKAQVRTLAVETLRSAISVEPVGNGDYFGFEVDGDHLFLLGDFTVTHNSLCYQLPALLRDGTTLVISPLIALMRDQVDAMQAAGVAATFINSSLDGAEQSARLAGLAAGRWKLCYIAPERLRNATFREVLAGVPISLLAVDEAHCISQWGHDFRPDYAAIGEAVETMRRPPIAALTATATPQVQDDIERQLGLRQPFRLVTGFNRANLRLDVRFTPGETVKQQHLKAFLDAQEPGACGIIYVGRRREAEEIAGFVRSVCRRPTVCYHAGMAGWERDAVQSDWRSGRAAIVVATNAFGMGVDKPDVRFVIHYALPGTPEGYYQEAGRAGRDGEPAHCLVLFDPSDARLHEWFIENDAPSLPELRSLFAQVRDEARRNGNRLITTAAHLAAVMDWKGDTKVRVGLKLLEQARLLEDLGERGGNGHWRLLPVEGRVDMAGPMQGVEQRRALKRRLLARVLDFAQTPHCRRQFLLDYFGDATPPVAEWCCDNCQRQREPRTFAPATTPEEMAPLYILDALKNLSYGVGRSLLAKILAGGRGDGMERYFTHPQYGLLRHMGRKEVQVIVDELVRERYLVIEAGQFPTLALSPSGQQAVEQRFAIPLSTSLAGQPVPGMRRVGPGRVTDTMAETLRLLNEGLEPDEIAETRSLSIGTIFNHFASLIERGELPVRRVVADERRALIEQAVQEVGSFYLSPIKARLPDEVEYGEIRCVVAAMQREGRQAEVTAPPAQRALFDRLMAWRKTEAQRLNQPPYFLLSNAVLQAIAEAQPRTLDALEAVRGVGPTKGEQFGAAILALLLGEEASTAPHGAHTVPPDDLFPPAAPPDVPAPTRANDAEVDTELTTLLRQWRVETARAEDVPAYIVFNNATLHALATHRPRTLTELQRIPGIGPAKAEKYGEALLALLNNGHTALEK